MPSKGGAHHQSLPSRNPQDTPPVASMMIPPNVARSQQTIIPTYRASQNLSPNNKTAT
jgi:uncharacterized Zn-finger protein